MKIKNCPFCKEKPHYYEYTALQSWDDAGHHNFGFTEFKTEKMAVPMQIPNMKELPAEAIECNNLKCLVRPRLVRVNTSDAIKVWNDSLK